jgi:hypothetical protein
MTNMGSPMLIYNSSAIDDVQQVFYVPNLSQKNWHVVMPRKKRILGVANVVDEEYYQFDELPSFAISPHDKAPYLQTDHAEIIHVQKARKKKI